MQCDEHQRAMLDQLFTTFDRRDIAYVIPRGHQQLPDAFPGSDLDVFVAAESFEAATAACEAVGLEAGGSAVANAGQLVGRAVRQPVAAVTYVLESPDEVVPYVRRQLSPGEPTQRGRRDRHYLDGELDVHLFNHLAYTSPMNGAKIRVDPQVEAWMLDRRIKGTVGSVPAPPDELLHLVCRGIFDYEGTFPGYYRRRCEQLVDEVTRDEHADAAFRRALEPVFFAAAELVYDHVTAGEFDGLRAALYRFSDY